MIRYFGHNCFLIANPTTSLIIDPWFSREGAFFGSWYQYPLNHSLRSEAIEALKKSGKSFVYLTHEHQDHFDLECLKDVVIDSKFIVPNFKDKFLIRELEKIGADVLEIEEKTTLNVDNNFSVRIFISDVGVNHDSAILINGHL